MVFSIRSVDALASAAAGRVPVVLLAVAETLSADSWGERLLFLSLRGFVMLVLLTSCCLVGNTLMCTIIVRELSYFLCFDFSRLRIESAWAVKGAGQGLGVKVTPEIEIFFCIFGCRGKCRR